MFKWEKGRLNTGYKKMKLFESKTFKFDAYILFYPEGSRVPPHTDKVKGYIHNRLNIILKKPKKGGSFYCYHMNPGLSSKRIVRFISDNVHGVLKIEKGYRLVLSFGWLRKSK